MQTSSIIVVAAIVIIAGAGIAGFMIMNGDEGGNDSTVSQDAVGREVVVPDSLDNGIVTVGGSGPLRFASMFDIDEYVVEVDIGDITDKKNGRAYSYAYGYDKLDKDTQSHSNNALEAADVEKIAKKEPSVVITTESLWNNYNENFEILAKSCNVVVLKNQEMKYMTEDGKLAEYMTFNINLLGTVFKKMDRAEDLIDGINDIISDIKSLNGTSNKKIYVSGVTIMGSNPLNTTFPTYIPFTLTNSANAYTGDTTPSKVDLTTEQFTSMDIDMIIIDPSSSNKIKDETGAVNNDSLYVMKYLYELSDSERPKMYITVPIVWDSINYDCALASAYVVSYLNYGSLTLDQLEEKVNGVFTTFYGDDGKDVLKDMTAFFVGKSTQCGQEMPIFGEVEIEKVSDTEYRFVAA